MEIWFRLHVQGVCVGGGDQNRFIGSQIRFFRRMCIFSVIRRKVECEVSVSQRERERESARVCVCGVCVCGVCVRVCEHVSVYVCGVCACECVCVVCV